MMLAVSLAAPGQQKEGVPGVTQIATSFDGSEQLRQI